ncbi:hypothetical protein ACVWVY_004749 [Bradyrhizobium sp. URHC0002]
MSPRLVVGHYQRTNSLWLQNSQVDGAMLRKERAMERRRVKQTMH